MIYFDNNGTTIIPIEVIKKINEWFNKGNPSAEYKSAIESRNMMEETKNLVATIAKCNLKDFDVIFTSGASESISTIIESCILSYKHITGKIPHVIVSSIEHKATLRTITDFVDLGLATLSYVEPNNDGIITANAVKRLIKYDTCLVCVMHANNETGNINEIHEIGAVCHDRKISIPFFTDSVQTFGKISINPGNDIDAFCGSFHKIHGPPGIGVLIIRKDLIKQMQLKSIIKGNQQNGFRGGTENIPYIAGVQECMKLSWKDRKAKNKKMLILKTNLIGYFHDKFSCITIQEYRKIISNNKDFKPSKLIVLITDEQNSMPNCILFAFINYDVDVCNSKIKKKLLEYGIIISIGSACNTNDPYASHVLNALKTDIHIKKGALRISLDDMNTQEEIVIFCKTFIDVLNQLGFLTKK